MRFLTAVALAAVMLWVPVDGVAQLTTAQELPEIGEIVTYPDGTKYRFSGCYRQWSMETESPRSGQRNYRRKRMRALVPCDLHLQK